MAEDEASLRRGDAAGAEDDQRVRLTDVLNGLPLPDPDIFTTIVNGPVRALWGLNPLSEREVRTDQPEATIHPTLELPVLEVAFQVPTLEAMLASCKAGNEIAPTTVGKGWTLETTYSRMASDAVSLSLTPGADADPSETPINITLQGRTNKVVTVTQGAGSVSLSTHSDGYRIDRGVNDSTGKQRGRIIGTFNTAGDPKRISYDVRVDSHGGLQRRRSTRRPGA